MPVRAKTLKALNLLKSAETIASERERAGSGGVTAERRIWPMRAENIGSKGRLERDPAEPRRGYGSAKGVPIHLKGAGQCAAGTLEQRQSEKNQNRDFGKTNREVWE